MSIGSVVQRIPNSKDLGPIVLGDPRERARWYWTVKHVLDRVIALALLIVLMPLLAVLAAWMRMTSRGAAWEAQPCLGLQGKRFRRFQFRTTVRRGNTRRTSEEQPDGPTTAVGRWLRATHLEQLPQLFNVLRGEMSLVGPRPQRPEAFAQLQEQFPHYHHRILVKPGITGLAQIRQASGSDLASSYRQLRYDLVYLRRASWKLDLWVLFKSVSQAVYGSRRQTFAGPCASIPDGAVQHGGSRSFAICPVHVPVGQFPRACRPFCARHVLQFVMRARAAMTPLRDRDQAREARSSESVLKAQFRVRMENLG